MRGSGPHLSQRKPQLRPGDWRHRRACHVVDEQIRPGGGFNRPQKIRAITHDRLAGPQIGVAESPDERLSELCRARLSARQVE